MSPSAATRFDWAGWRADVAERIDRRAVGVALAWVALSMALNVAGPNDAGAVALHVLFKLGTVMAIFVVLAVALVAVARGTSVWVAYPCAALASAAIVAGLGIVIDPWRWLAGTPPPRLSTVILGYLYSLWIVCPFAVLYAYASSAAQDERALRAVEAERMAQAERLARQRLETEGARVDHGLVLRAMRSALNAPAGGTGQAEPLLDAVADYLRAAQQRGASGPGDAASALAALRRACEAGGAEPAQPAVA